jgi:hypothetical protein
LFLYFQNGLIISTPYYHHHINISRLRSEKKR